MLEDLDLDCIVDEQARALVRQLLNLLEDVSADLRAAQAEIQHLRNEIHRLKGEQGQPTIKPNTPPPDLSSEQERRTPKAWSKGRKRDRIPIDRAHVVTVDPAGLPPDAVFKGYEDVVVQDVVFRTDNVLFHKEKFYSPSQQQTYLASLPQGYHGQFGPGIKSLALVFYYGAQMSEPKVAELLRSVGVQISDGQVSNLLIKDQGAFHAEKAALYQAGLTSSPWQHLDDTSTRVNGHNGYCHVVCNPLYTAYFTTSTKDRLTIIDVLTNHRPRRFVVNTEALGYVQASGLSAVRCQQLAQVPSEVTRDEAAMQALLETHLPGLGPQQRKWILDATAVAAYHAEVEFPVVRLLVCDDAPQFTLVTEALALCWVHEGRHYKKLLPSIPYHQRLLEAFVQRFWLYYAQLLAYRQQPAPEAATRLTEEFETLFSTVTGYQALDERIAKTRAKQRCLLMVLTHPEIPLHNNPAELGARARVRKRDVSFGPRTREGATAWDTFMTLAATATKLGVSFYHYIHDRVSGASQMPALADLISERAQDLTLGASWNTS
ncbi:MAG TPA: transposase [Candidatus Saccharimonadia bacterium]|nr:transposase [Candidatus Saccharimonadia bacterium]